jgi:hypothetical protein
MAAARCAGADTECGITVNNNYDSGGTAMISKNKKQKGVNMINLVTLTCLVFVFATNCFAGRIGTNFAEVKVDKLQVGQTHSMKEKFNLPFNVINLSDDIVNLKLWVEIPSEEELKPGYEPIPNPEWVYLEKTSMTVQPHKTGISDIFISIPKKKRYLGKKYHVSIVAETVDPAGKGFIVFGVSLKGRLLITTADKITSNRVGLSGKKDDEGQKLNFLLRPWEIIIPELTVGKFYNLYEEMGISLSLDYPHKKKALFVIESLTAKEAGIELPDGFEDAPDKGFLEFSTKKTRFKKKGKKEIKVFLKFPDEENYRNKNYIFVIRASLVDEKTGKKLFSVYSRLYIHTK